MIEPSVDEKTLGANSSVITGKDEKKKKKKDSELDRLFKERKQSKCQRRCEKFLDSWYVAIVMTIVTFYALFGDDLRFILLPKAVDNYWYAMTCISMILFFLEILIGSYAKLDYPCSFYFWLDLVSTFSMISDVGWVTDQFQSYFQNSAGNLAQTSRAARVTRIIRLVRLIRLVRIVKLYKQAKLAQYKRDMQKMERMRKQKEIEK